MSQQPEMISPSLPATPAPQPDREIVSGSRLGSATGAGPAGEREAQPKGPAPEPIPPWLEASELLLRVLVQMCIGLVLCFAPWSGFLITSPHWLRAFWDENPLLLQSPTVAIYAANGAVRGIVSGLGVLNLWLAFRGAIRHGMDER